MSKPNVYFNIKVMKKCLNFILSIRYMIKKSITTQHINLKPILDYFR